jgi:TonB-linked SusC/RagA family outer membrane protein
MKKFLLLSGLMVLVVSILSAQTKVITGKIGSSVAGEGPIPGVTVQAKGTTIGTTSDVNGQYTITVPSDATTLVFTYIGMKKQEIEIAGRSTIDVEMEYDIQSLQEVVVTTGYGIKRAPKSSSSLTQVISSEKLNEVREPNIISALAGKVAGIQIRNQSAAKLNSGQPYARLRGASGFVVSPKVIYVVDGTVLPNTADINMDDIDNVSVLSGPTAAAILGSQGANGAIIISTKKAKTTGSKSTEIEVNSGFLASYVYILPSYQNDYAGGNTPNMYKYTWKDTDPLEWKPLDGKYYPNYSDDASWGPRMAGQEYIPWYAWYPGTKYTGKTTALVPQPDNARKFFDVGMNYNNNIIFNKTGENFNIRALIGNIYARGSIPSTSFDKTSLALKTDYQINKKLTFSANINFFTSMTVGDFYDAYGNTVTGSFNSWFHRDLDMDILRELRELRSPVGSLATWNHMDPLSYNPENPILFYGANYWLNFFTYRDLEKQDNRSDRLFGDIFLSYKIIEGLDFKITYRRQENNVWSEYRSPSDIYESFYNSSSFPGYGSYSSSMTYSNRENFETLLTFTRKFGSFAVNANAGSDFFNTVNRNNNANTSNGLNVRNLFTISNSKTQPATGFSRSMEKYRAIFIRGDIGFKDYIFGEFTLRNDWFSALPPANNSILSKSFGGSFVFSDLLKLPWLSFGKLRASWGEIPTSIGAYVYPGYSYSVNQYQWNTNFVMTTPDQIVDPKIKGDVKTQKEIGLELRFLNNRAGITATYWDGSEKNIPYNITIAAYSGSTSKYMNTGKIIKQGVDLVLNLKPLNLTNLKWDLNSTFAWLIRDKIVKIADGVDRYILQELWGGAAPALVHAAGYQWGQLFGSGKAMYNGKPLLNPDGSYVANPEKYFGSILPKFTGGLQNSFRIFKNFTLAANIDYQYGGKFWSVSEMLGDYSGLSIRTTGLNDKGIPIRDPVEDGGGVHVFGVDATTRIPMLPKEVDYYVDAYTYFHNFSNKNIYDPYVFDLTYIKFRELSISYSLPIEKIGNLKKFMTSANVSLVAQNFWLIYSKNHNIDPAETQYVDGDGGGQFPGFRSFGMNIKINF